MVITPYIIRRPYWEKLVSYYYDNIHFNEDPCPSIYQWLKREYNADTNIGSAVIMFDDPKDMLLFKLRWD